MPFRHRDRRSPLQVEFDVFARAIGGAMLFGVPLLFTMEMWWIGEHTSGAHLLGFLLVTFVVNISLARMSGFRKEDNGLVGDVGEALEAMAVGVVLSLAVLTVLDRIDTMTSIEAVAGMVAIQVIPLSIGAMVGNLVFDPEMGRTGQGGAAEGSALQELVSDVAATFAGAIFVGFAIAPTEEVPMLAAALNGWNLIAMVGFALVAGYVIVFASGFDPSHRGPHPGGLFQRPFSETVLALVVSCVASILMLYGFGQISFDGPLNSVLIQVMVLAVPASIGGAAGRVVV